MQCAACGNGQNSSTRGSCALPWSPESPARAAVARLEQPNLVQQHRVLYTPRALPVPAHSPCPPTHTLGTPACQQPFLCSAPASQQGCELLLSSPTAVSAGGEANASSAQWAQILIRPQHNTGGERHKTINSWLLVVALGKGRCTIEREETGTDRGWDVLQEPQGRQRWLPTPQTQGCSPTGEGSGRLLGRGNGESLHSKI